MEITPNGRSLTETSFLKKLAYDLIEKQSTQESNKEDYSTKQTDTHTIQIKRIGLLGDLPPGVTNEMWTTPENARKLQQF